MTATQERRNARAVMINLLIALGAGVAVVALVKALGLSLIAGIIPDTQEAHHTPLPVE